MNMKKSKSSVKAVMMLFFLTIVTKIVGFLKTSITAASFGVSIETDIYNLADGVCLLYTSRNSPLLYI